MSRDKIYVTGASGRLGRVVLQKIPDAVPLARRHSNPPLPREKITDFSTDSLRDIFKDAMAVIHLAGLIVSADQKKMEEANEKLTWRIVDSLPKDTKIIFSSSIAVYGKKMAAQPADENTAPRPDSAYAKTKLEAEKTVSKHPNHCILRIATIYGPQFGDYFMILKKIEQGKMRIIGSGENKLPFVHVEDVADAIAKALTKGSGTYVLAGEPLTQNKVYEIASRELGVPKPVKKISEGGAGTVASISELISPLLGKRPTTREQVAVLASDRAFNCTKAKNELGFSPRPLEQGIKEMVGAYRASENVKNTNR